MGGEDRHGVRASGPFSCPPRPPHHISESGLSAFESGGREGIRTPGLLVANEALSQLSYSPNLVKSKQLITSSYIRPLARNQRRSIRFIFTFCCWHNKRMSASVGRNTKQLGNDRSDRRVYPFRGSLESLAAPE